MAKITKPKQVYVLTREHYHFPPNDTDMVGATPIGVYAGTDTSRIRAQIEAHKLAQEHCTKFGGEIKIYKGEGRECFRVWVNSLSEHCDKFIWVVRRVDYLG